MTPKEKAEELVNKIQYGLFDKRAVDILREDAIFCALICVDEIINTNPHSKEFNWVDVKKELLK